MANIYSFSSPQITWSEEQQKPLHSPWRVAGGYALGAAGLGAAYFAGFARPWSHLGDNENLYTKAYRAVDAVEKSVLYGMPATFRVPFFISPYVQHEAIREATGNLFSPVFAPEVFKTKEAMDVFGSLLGLKPSEMHGISTHGLRLERQDGTKWYRAFIGDRLVKEDIVLYQRGRSKEFNRGLQAVLGLKDEDVLFNLQEEYRRSKTDLGGKTWQQIEEAFRNPPVGEGIGYHVGSVKSPGGQIESMGRSYEFFPVHIGGGTQREARHKLFETRLVGAASINRLNELIRTITQQVPILSDVVQQLPLRFTVKEGSFLKTIGRYGYKAAVLGTAPLITGEISRLRREEPIKGVIGFGILGSSIAIATNNQPVSLLDKALSKRSAKGFAIGALLGATPLFKHGVYEGLGQIWAGMQIAGSSIGEVTGLNAYRRWWENAAPGSGDFSTAVGVGLFAYLGGLLHDNLRGIKRPGGVGGRFYPHTTARAGILDIVFPNREHLKSVLSRMPSNTQGYTSPLQLLRNRRFDLWAQAQSQMQRESLYQGYFSHGTTGQAPEFLRTRGELNLEWAKRITSEARFGKRIGLQIRAALEGADPTDFIRKHSGSSWWRKGGFKGLVQGEWSLPFGKGSTRFLMGAVGWSLLTGGLLGWDKSPQELKDIYSGKELVPVTKGRYWEAGGSPWSGTNIMYYKPHWLPLLLSRAKERSLWGSDENDISSFEKFRLKHFTYELEQRNYWTRPYPITGVPLSETPFVRGLLDPITRLIKPPKLMHVSDWARIHQDTGAAQIKQISSSMDIQPAYAYGGLHAPVPESPYSSGRRLGQFIYQAKEGAGLVGWASSLINKTLTGSETPFMSGTVMQSSANMDSMTSSYWEMNLGGFGFLSEPVRRFIPKMPSTLGSWNPISNNMPAWLPEEYRTGSPLDTTPGGYYRLPGEGYSALHPELQGLTPNQYPLYHQYSILSDIAPWSEEFQTVSRTIKWQMKQGLLTDNIVEFIERADARLQRKRQKREFDNHLWDMNAHTQELGLIGRAVRAAWGGGTSVLHDIFAGPEKLIPLGFRPIEKLFPQLNPIEEYEDTVLYGTNLAFWDKPMRDWFRPALYQTMHDWFGWNGIPKWQRERWNVEEYYDKMEFYKWKNLEIQAMDSGDLQKAKLYKKLARRTVYGVNPFERDIIIKASLPQPYADFYDAFVSTEDERERTRIMEMLPESVGRIFEAQWMKRDAELSGSEKQLDTIAQLSRVKGEPLNASLEQQFQREAPDWMTYGDWYKLRALDQYFKDKPFPEKDWIAWAPEIDIKDVKLKTILNEDEEIHDFNMWDSQVRMLSRKPYLTDEVVNEANYWNSGADRNFISTVMDGSSIDTQTIRAYQYESEGAHNDIDITYKDNRRTETTRLKDRWGIE